MMPFMLIQLKIETDISKKVKIKTLGIEYLYIH